MTETDLKAKYTTIFRANGITDEISEVTTKIPEYLIGEQAGSICELVTVYYKDETKSPQQLFVKKILPVNSAEGADRLALTEGIMRNEGTFLTTFVSEMSKFCEEKLGAEDNVDVQLLFPKTYFANLSEIIMENMTGSGYFMLNKTELHNFEVARQVLRNLTKMHGVSYCLVQRDGGKEPFLEKNPNFNEMMFAPGGSEMISTIFEPIIESITGMFDGDNSLESLRAHQKLKSYKGKLASTFCDILRLPSVFNVVNHGDLWNNNMMFSPEGKENPESAKIIFVDFQTMRCGSPCLDIAHYIFTSTQPSVRKRTKELLKFYFDDMSELVQRLGEQFPYTFENFLADYGIKSKLELFYGIVTPIALEAIKSYDPSKSDGSDEAFAKMMNEWLTSNTERAGEIITDVKSKIADFEKLGQL